MKIDEVMTSNPACCLRTETAQKAAIIMLELNVGVIPVLESDSSQKLVGLVTDRDLCMEVVALGSDPTQVKLEDCMTTGLVTCHQNDDVEHVLHLMQENQVRRIPVVDDEQRIVGIVATSDMVLCADLTPEEIDETIQDISEPSLEEFQSLTGLVAMDAGALLNVESQAPGI